MLSLTLCMQCPKNVDMVVHPKPLFSFFHIALAERIKGINNAFCGPIQHHSFNGRESDVIIHVTSYNLDLQSMARARRLLIIVTHGYEWRKGSAGVKAMDLATEKKLAKKISFEPIADQEIPLTSSSPTVSKRSSPMIKKKCLIM